jgi:CBS domain-containing protein
MLVRDALVAHPFVVTPTTTLFELIDGILAGNQTTASVIEQGFLLGTVSAMDVLKRLVPSYVSMDENLAGVLHPTFFEETLSKLHNVIVGDVMERDVDTLPPDASVMQAVAMFVRYGRKTLPVVENGRFVGAVTRRSVLRLVRSSVGG